MTKPISKPFTLDESHINPEADREAIHQLSVLVKNLTGVQLNERHSLMVSSRLTKRISELGLPSMNAYLDYLKVNSASEVQKLVGLLTTHHTFFFREFSHFEFISQKALPQLISIARARADKKIRVWSAACSKGQEVYSLAMYLDFHLKKMDPSIGFEILGTDVDVESVEYAKNGVYLRSELSEAPLTLLGDHWVRGSGDIQDYVKARKSLRERCQFQPLNLLDLKPGAFPTARFDLIFCRNVFIYFETAHIHSITQELLSRLNPEGFLFVGLSESLSGQKLPIESLGPSVYQHPKKSTAPKATSPKANNPAAVIPTRGEKTPIRVVCVDDSPSILTLMKQILSQDSQFQCVGTASDGIEAAQKIAELKPDVVTLDIHMPRQNGIEYLEKNYRSGHPPVVMVTSVSRDNSDLAGKALDFGAADYVEKPGLSNLMDRGEEIRNKLQCAVLYANDATRTTLQLDHSFQRHSILKHPENKLRMICFPLSAREKIKSLFKELSGQQPPTLLIIEGAGDAQAGLIDSLSKEFQKSVHLYDPTQVTLKSGEMYCISPQELEKIAASSKKYHAVSILVYGEVSKKTAQSLLAFHGAQLIVEDQSSRAGTKLLVDVASDLIPATSFAYHSHEFFCDYDQGSETKKAA